jgi:hypothetical protein
MDIIAILKLVIQTMETTEKLNSLNGEEKRDAVLTYLKKNLTQYDKYEDMVVIMIEVVIILSRTKLLINAKKKCNLLCGSS